jgi:uncharacterized protein (TIRG00374 family)
MIDIPKDRSDTGTYSRKALGFDRIFRLVLILIPLGVIGNVIFSMATSDLKAFSRLTGLSSPILLLAILSAFLPWVTYMLRLWIWLRFSGIPFRLRDLLKIAFAHELGSAITPSAIGGAPVKAVLLMKLGANPGKALVIMIMGTLEELAFLAIVFPMLITLLGLWDLPVFSSIFESIRSPYGLYTILALLLLAVTIWLGHLKGKTFLGRRSFFRNLARKFAKTAREFISVLSFILKKGKVRFLVCVLLTTVGWMFRFYVVVLLVESMGMKADFKVFAALQWLLYNSAIAMPTPGGAVGIEALFFIFFKPYVGHDLIGIVTLGWRFITFYLVNIVAAVFLLFLSLREPQAQRRMSE